MKLCPTCRRCYEDADESCAADNSALAFARPGTRLVADKYRLDRLLGRGGMGAVYAGLHVELDRPVAVKLLLHELVADPQALERFRREARAAARINHPNVIDLYDYGLLSGSEAYIVMEMAGGQTLRELMNASGALDYAQAIEIARQVAEGVGVAHRNDIIHRDLKPSNIILTRDHEDKMLVKVVDFGIAKLKELTTSGGVLTNTGSLVGTPRYMSPEQCGGHEIDARSDIYALGVILYEMVAGRPPFDAPSATALALKHVQEQPAPLASWRDSAPPALCDLVRRTLDKNPSARPETAAALAQELAQLAETLPASPNPTLTDGVAVASTGSLTLPAGTGDGANERLSSREPVPRDDSREQATGRSGLPTVEEPADVLEVFSEPPVNATSHALAQDAAGHVSTPPINTQQTPPARAVIETRTENVAPAVTHQTSVQEGFNTEGQERKSIPLPALLGGGLLIAAAVAAVTFWLLSLGSDSPAVVNSNASPSRPAPTSENRNSGAIPAAPANSNSAAPQSPSRAQEERALKNSLAAWVAATNSRDVNRQMLFYLPRLTTYYLATNATRESVMRDKQSIFEAARAVRISVNDPVVSFSPDGASAEMNFLKEYEIEGGGGSRKGVVRQELVWSKTKEGWRISSERDTQVLR